MEERIGCWKRLEVLGEYICGGKEGLFLSEFTFSFSTPSKLGMHYMAVDGVCRGG